MKTRTTPTYAAVRDALVREQERTAALRKALDDMTKAASSVDDCVYWSDSFQRAWVNARQLLEDENA